MSSASFAALLLRSSQVSTRAANLHPALLHLHRLATVKATATHARLLSSTSNVRIDSIDSINSGNEYPAERPLREGRMMRCYRCNQLGHTVAQCTEPKLCYNCGQQGHGVRECPEPRRPRKCHNCGKEGHLVSQCPEWR